MIKGGEAEKCSVECHIHFTNQPLCTNFAEEPNCASLNTISEAYWAQMRVKGSDLPVLIQAYQRRLLTYVPGFASEWQVQQGNVGQHYLEWRYNTNGLNLAVVDPPLP